MIEGTDDNLSELETEHFAAMIARAVEDFPNFQVAGTTMRSVKSATVNGWGAIAWSQETGVVESTPSSRS